MVMGSCRALGLCGSAAVRAARVLRRDGRHDISSRRTSTGPSPLEGPPAWHLWRPLHVPHRARTASTARPPRAGARGEQPGAFEAEVHRLKVPPDLAGALRLDTFLSEAVKDKTRARLQGCIKEGLVQVNGEQRCKTGYRLRPGDCVTLALPPPPPLNAVAEPIPLNIVFEDPDLLVVHKEAGMVTHPAPGNYTGTLVNALLSHCSLPSPQLVPRREQERDTLGLRGDGENPSTSGAEEDECDDAIGLEEAGGNIRPGIVHRLDKGTSGLIVVAKSEAALQSLAQQFKDRTVQRTYVSVAVGIPSPPQGRVETNIDRDPHDRTRMAAFPYNVGGGRGRHAASNYKVVEELCGRRASVVAWKLDTGRTHQIRVHAKHLNCPLFGDESYGGGVAAGAERIARGSAGMRAAMSELLDDLGRPALHAATLGFTHPVTGEGLSFSAPVPADMMHVIASLRRT